MLSAHCSAGLRSTAPLMPSRGEGRAQGHLSCPSCITSLERPLPSSLTPVLSGPLISQGLIELPVFPAVPHSQTVSLN